MKKNRFLLLLINSVILLIALIVLIMIFPVLSKVIQPFIIALILSYLLNPFVKALMERGLKKGMAVTVVMLGTFFVLVLVVTMLFPQMVESIGKMTNALPALSQDISTAGDSIQQRLESLFGTSFVSQNDLQGMLTSGAKMLEDALNSLSQALLQDSNFMDLVIIPIVCVLLMLNTGYLRDMFSYFIPTSGRTVSRKMMTDFDRVVGGFVRGQTLMSLTAGIITGIGCAILGLPYAMVIGIITAFTSFVPYFGPVVALVILVLLTIWTSVFRTLILIVIFGAAQVVCGNVLAPMLMADSVGIRPIGIIFSVLFFGQCFGNLGMLLAVPIAGILKVLFSYAIKAAAEPVSDGKPTRFTPVLERTEENKPS